MNPVAAPAAHRVFLFLQGPSSSLFYKIAANLEAADHTCLRVNLNAGDWLFWRRRGGLNYRGRFSDWPAYIEGLLISRHVTDLILLGEERPYHRVAVDLAKAHGIAVTVIEMGYLRPDWVTVERDGMSSNSKFPRDPTVIKLKGGSLPQPNWERKYRQSFVAEAAYDLSYYLPTIFLGVFYPHYRFHGIFYPLTEYAGWIGRLTTQRSRNRKAEYARRSLVDGAASWFVYPLQLETDYQLRAHSRYESQRDAISEIMSSFAAWSPVGTKLAIKVHPLDNGLISWSKFVRKEAKRLAIEKRIIFFDGGDYSNLLEGCRGVVTVNSTAALQALRAGIPVITLGSAIFDVEGLTHQEGLDRFWSYPFKPQTEVLEAYIALLAASIHERGNFYSEAGSSAAAYGIASRLLNDRVNEVIVSSEMQLSC